MIMLKIQKKVYGDKQLLSNIYTFKYVANNEEVEIKIGVVSYAFRKETNFRSWI